MTTTVSCHRCATGQMASCPRRPRRRHCRLWNRRRHDDDGGPAGRGVGGDCGDGSEPGTRSPVWEKRTEPLRERRPSCAGSSASRACWTGRADALLMGPQVVGSRCTTPEETCPPRSSLWPRRLQKHQNEKLYYLSSIRI